MKIPLFDIDGTLFKTGSLSHRYSFAYAFEKIYKVKATQTEINPEGMVDNQIIVEVLKLHGLSEEEIKPKIKQATNAMTEYMEKHKDDVKPEILPGVLDLLNALKQKNVPLGLLTGNVEEMAWIKLEKGGIKDFFSFGAFGDKAYKRVELVEHARQNAEKALGRTVDKNELMIIGDTPKDIACAKDAGIQVIAVSTGIFPFEELVDEKPDLAIHSLEEIDSVLKFLNN